MQSKVTGEANSAVIYIYNNYKEQEIQTLEHLVGSILTQMLQKKMDFSDNLKGLEGLYQRHARLGTRPKAKELLELIRTEISGFSRVFILVDAVDECTEANGRRATFLLQLQEILEAPQVRLMMTARPINQTISDFPNVAKVEIRASDDDIQKYIEAQISREARLRLHTSSDKTLKEDIITKLTANANGM